MNEIINALMTSDPNRNICSFILNGIGTKDYFEFDADSKESEKIHFKGVFDVNKIKKCFKLEDFIGLMPRNLSPYYTDKLLYYICNGSSIHRYNEKFIWQSDLSDHPGILTQLKTSGIVCANLDSVDLTTYNNDSILQHINILVDIQQKVKPEFTYRQTIMSMSTSNFYAYAKALYNLNSTNKDVENIKYIIIPNTLIKVIPMIGLIGRDEIVITTPENIKVKYSIESEDNMLKLFHNLDEEFSYYGEYGIGVYIKNLNNFILTKLKK